MSSGAESSFGEAEISFDEAESSLDDQEPSILEYARYHGLASYHMLDDDDDFDPRLIEAASFSFDDDDVNALTNFVVDTGILDEKLILDADARAVLASIFQAGQKSETYPLELDIRRTKHVRLEEPLLFTDPKLDVKQYLGARLAAQTELRIDVDKLPLFPIDEQSDEALGWPEKYHTLPVKYDKHIADEKIQVPKEALLFLHQVCQPGDTHEHIHAIMESELKYKRNKAMEPLTPPLSPYLSVPNSPDSSSPILKPISYTVWSDASGDNGKDVTLDEAMVEAEDILGLEGRLDKNIDDPIMTDEIAQLYSPLRQRYSQEPLSSSSPLRRVHRLKVEPPMSPIYHTQPPSSDGLRLDKIPLWSMVNSQPLDEEIRTTFETYIEPAALQLQDTLLNERLVDPRITERLVVPNLDVSAFVAPWELAATEEVEEDELRMIKLPIAKSNLHHWSASKLDNSLRWNPFPNFHYPNLDEDVRESELLDKFLKLGLEDCVNPNTLTWKPEGFRILEVDDEEEDLLSEPELEQDNSAEETPSGIDKLLMQVEQATVATYDGRPSRASQSSPLLCPPQPRRPPSGSKSSPLHFHHQPKSLVRAALDFSTLLKARHPTDIARSAHEDVLSAPNELGRFMDLQGQQAKRRKLEHSSSTLPSPVRAVATPNTHFVTGTAPIATMTNRVSNFEERIELPPIPANLPDRQIIASQTLTANIQLFRQLANLYPNLDIIERESKAYPQSNLKSSSSTGHDSADITLSPSHGILVTNIARLHQLPLPGSACSPSASIPGHTVRAQITAASPYYKHLTVIVSSTVASADRLNQHDTKALAALRTFAMQVPDGVFHTKVEIVVAPGGIEGLTHYITKVIAESRHQQKVQLLPEETIWEGRLRAAGMNAWAAQIVLACLDVEDGGGVAEVWQALARLAAMQEQEKVQIFSQAMGDEAMARRVSTALSRMVRHRYSTM